MALDEKQIKNIVEAALYAAEGTLNVERLLGLFIEDGTRPTREQIIEALQTLQDDYRERGVSLVEVSSGYRFQVDQDLAPWVSRLWEEKPPRYSRALLETLALIAYRQPITRAEIEEVRGVAVSSNILKTLLERDWVKVVGHKEVPGKPALYATTRAFLDYFNLKSLNELPSLAELQELEGVTAELDLEPEAQADTEQGSGEDGQGEGGEGQSAGPAETADAEAVDSSAEAEPEEQDLAEDEGDPGLSDVDDGEQAVAAAEDEDADLASESGDPESVDPMELAMALADEDQDMMLGAGADNGAGDVDSPAHSG